MDDWTALTPDARHRRAAQALRDDDLRALAGLLEAHLLLTAPRGLATSRHTVASYRAALASMLAYSGQVGRKLHRWTEEDARRWTRHLEGRPMAASSVNCRLAGARRVWGALTWAGTTEGVSPFADLALRDPTPTRARGRGGYTAAEVALMLAVAEQVPAGRALLLLSLDAGLRLAEVAALHWADVDWPARQLTVRAGKGGGRDQVAATDRLLSALLDLAGGPSPSGPILGVGRRALQRRLARLCDLAGVPRRGHHALRHHCATRMYALGRDLLAVQRHLRHSQVTTTQRYAREAEAAYRAAVDLLDGDGETADGRRP